MPDDRIYEALMQKAKDAGMSEPQARYAAAKAVHDTLDEEAKRQIAEMGLVTTRGMAPEERGPVLEKIEAIREGLGVDVAREALRAAEHLMVRWSIEKVGEKMGAEAAAKALLAYNLCKKNPAHFPALVDMAFKLKAA